MTCQAIDIAHASFSVLLNVNHDNLTKIAIDIPLPSFSKEIINDVCDEAIRAFQNEDTLIELCSPINIVGDIHGSLHDLIRILTSTDVPQTKFLFLGDYVDRGSFSVEVIMLLLILHLVEPGKYFLIRGNHEFEDICSKYGFRDELIEIYGNDGYEIFDKFNQVFSYMPLAATIDGEVFCTHGGISPNLSKVEQIKELKRPIFDYNDELVCQLVWSDPSPLGVMFIRSDRSMCLNYGLPGVQNFVKDTHMKYIFRAHQCVLNGVQWENQYVATVFSSSNYSMYMPNRSGMIIVNNINSIEELTFDPIEKFPRSMASFYSVSLPRLHKRKKYFSIKYSSPSLLYNSTSLPFLHVNGVNNKSSSLARKNNTLNILELEKNSSVGSILSKKRGLTNYILSIPKTNPIPI